ncbi:RNA polymerase sigma factor [uncultured Caudovirales phage]|uniref:RNA polymerase sigma-like factor n=1 Tax=uncultured Caudovirales phage TaxID=2100421 RepID=A0A6J5KSV2_9CAUD|nr:RNA polymerase sigma factor [uncultured Caudovirales phage]
MAKKNHYVNNADLLKTIEKYKLDCATSIAENTKKPKIPDYIGKCLMLIAENLSHKPNFISYTFRDEMIADGIENCIMYFDNFDPNKSKNPFAYFTQIIYFAFIRRIHKEKKQLYVKYKSTEHVGVLDEAEQFDSDEMGIRVTRQYEQYENISEFIDNYEKAKAKKKKSSKKSLELLMVDDELIEEVFVDG